MPSGRTHDSITLWSLPLVVVVTLERTRSSHLTLIVAAGFLFSGLMFGPDLDIYSRQYRRWGALRWIWLPYQRGMSHRSLLSHGPLVGTAIRILYLSVWLVLFGVGAIVVAAIAAQMLGTVEHWQVLAQHLITESNMQLGRSLQQSTLEWITLAIGLELGAMSHAMSDGAEFVYKRLILKHLNRVTGKANGRKPQPNPLPEAILPNTENLKPPRSNLPDIAPTTQQPASSHRNHSPQSGGSSRRTLDLPSFKRPEGRDQH